MNFNITDKKEIILITLISSILVAYYINFNNNLGIYCSDVYVYLLNALYFESRWQKFHTPNPYRVHAVLKDK